MLRTGISFPITTKAVQTALSKGDVLHICRLNMH